MQNEIKTNLKIKEDDDYFEEFDEEGIIIYKNILL
jgi:hypothetical protein